MGAKFEADLYKALLAAGITLGERAKGMSCFYRNWKSAFPAGDEEQVDERQAA